MDELRREIEKGAEGIPIDFVSVSIKWATYCLKNLKDDLLAKGLDVARALSQFETTLRNLQGNGLGRWRSTDVKFYRAVQEPVGRNPA